MPVSAPDGRLYVVVGVLFDEQGNVLIQQRRSGTPRAGQWEFPGGKLERDESAEQALARELHEELGITVCRMEPLVAIPYNYEHARVWLDTRLVVRYSGKVRGREGQAIAWVAKNRVTEYDILEAVHPILDALVLVPAPGND
jgi:8-oxo-dGTP diphosphatase